MPVDGARRGVAFWAGRLTGNGTPPIPVAALWLLPAVLLPVMVKSLGKTSPVLLPCWASATAVKPH